MMNFAELEPKQKIIVVGGAVLVGYFLLRAIMGGSAKHVSTASVPVQQQKTDASGGAGQNTDAILRTMSVIQEDTAKQIADSNKSVSDSLAKQADAQAKSQKDALSGIVQMIAGIQANTTHQIDAIQQSNSQQIAGLQQTIAGVDQSLSQSLAAQQQQTMNAVSSLLSTMARPQTFAPNPHPFPASGGGGMTAKVNPDNTYSYSNGNSYTTYYPDNTDTTTYDSGYSTGTNPSAGSYQETVGGTTYYSDAPTVYNGGDSNSPAYYDNGQPVYL